MSERVIFHWWETRGNSEVFTYSEELALNEKPLQHARFLANQKQVEIVVGYPSGKRRYIKPERGD